MIGFRVRPPVAWTAVAALALLTGCGTAKPAASPGAASPIASSATGATGGTAAPTSVPADGGGGGGGGGAKACGLISAQDVSTALGKTVGPGRLGGTASASECVYADGALIISTISQGTALYHQQRAALVGAPAGSWSEVSGVGDGAFEVSAGSNVSVAFLKGTTVVQIVMRGVTASPTDPAITLARAAAANV